MTTRPKEGGECAVRKSPWKQPGTWGVLAFLVTSGAIAGGSIATYFVQQDANSKIADIKAAYAEAGETRLAALTMCLKQTTGAANTAATAARKAAEKADEAKVAADNAAAAATSSANPAPTPDAPQ